MVVAAADNMRVVSTFTPATFCPAGIHKPHDAQPNLLLLCDLMSPLFGHTRGNKSGSGAASCDITVVSVLQ